MITKQLTPADVAYFGAMLMLFKAVFEMDDFKMPDELFLKKLLKRDDFVAYVTMDEELVVGGVTAYILPSYYDRVSQVYIYDLGVRAEYRRQGVGRELLKSINDHCHQKLHTGFDVQAYDADTHALDFYRSTGHVPEKAIHFSYPISKSLQRRHQA